MKPVTIEKAKAIRGWMSEAELTWLALRAREARIIIEVGSYLGRSTRALADNTEGIIYTIDPYSGPYYTNKNTVLFEVSEKTYEQFYKNLADRFSSGKLIHFRGLFKDFILPQRGADFIFIDGDHRHDAVLADIKRAIKLINVEGVIAGHDYGDPNWPGVKEAVDYLFKGFKIEFVDTIWYVEL